MKPIVLLFALCSLIAIPGARAESSTESVQQALKDQGFYYGEVTGRKDADTAAAIRRYQIRNGLKITGDINAETEKSLGLKITTPSARTTPTPHASLAPRIPPPPDAREEAPESEQLPPPRGQTFRQPAPDYVPGPRDWSPQTRGLFVGTPYETAPPEQQQRVILSAQSLLARQGYYRSELDGIFGPGMEFALRAYQTRFRIPPSGRLDRATLATLGLLPGQRAPGVTAPTHSRMYPPRGGEPVYIPR